MNAWTAGLSSGLIQVLKRTQPSARIFASCFCCFVSGFGVGIVMPQVYRGRRRPAVLLRMKMRPRSVQTGPTMPASQPQPPA